MRERLKNVHFDGLHFIGKVAMKIPEVLLHDRIGKLRGE